MKKSALQNKYGFSLIETLIAVSILMIAITGPLALVQAGLFSSIHQRNEVTAVFLAQEAIEYVKSVRDANSYTQYTTDPVPWLTLPIGGDLLTLCAVGCYVDPHAELLDSAFVVVKSEVGKKLLGPLMDSSTGAFISYSYNASADVGTGASFERLVKISPVGNIDPVTGPDEVKVTVTMNWFDNALPRSYTVSTNLLNYEIAKLEDVTGGDPAASGAINASLEVNKNSEQQYPYLCTLDFRCGVANIATDVNDPNNPWNRDWCQIYEGDSQIPVSTQLTWPNVYGTHTNNVQLNSTHTFSAQLFESDPITGADTAVGSRKTLAPQVYCPDGGGTGGNPMSMTANINFEAPPDMTGTPQTCRLTGFSCGADPGSGTFVDGGAYTCNVYDNGTGQIVVSETTTLGEGGSGFSLPLDLYSFDTGALVGTHTYSSQIWYGGVAVSLKSAPISADNTFGDATCAIVNGN
ncbi:TPA: hypothetical protein DCQ44_03565 [Candidatus Taylorbacteria bacterium]|nr:hypothetical protein [Candidatus Taylorbacteria bacterium]